MSKSLEQIAGHVFETTNKGLDHSGAALDSFSAFLGSHYVEYVPIFS